MHAEYLDVVAGVVRDRQGRVLLAQRPAGKPLAGLWEFPGGKRDPLESALAALARELREELGIEIHDARRLLATMHTQADRRLRLDAWTIDSWSGEATGLEDQALAWVPIAELDAWPMPAPDRPIVNALRLPPCYVITPEPGEDHDAFLVAFSALLERLSPRSQTRPDRPARPRNLVQLRCKQGNDQSLRALALACRALALEHDSDLLLNGRPTLAAELGIGLHLTSAQLRTWANDSEPLAAITARPAPPWLAASCHDAAELTLAAHIGCDFVTVSPVLASASHPGASTLDWSGLATLTADSAVPCYALGGLGREHLTQAREHGAFGVAGIRAFWS